jgi:hypothetical protein
MKTEEAFLKKRPQALLLKTPKHKTQVFEVFLKRAIVDTNVVEVDCNDLV